MGNSLLKPSHQLLTFKSNYTRALSSYFLRQLKRDYTAGQAKALLLLCLLGMVSNTYASTNSGPLSVSQTNTSTGACNTSLSVVVTAATCSSGGAINLTVQGGTAPFTYQWTGPNGFTNATKDINGLSAGVYTANVTDATQCITTIQATINAPVDTTPPVILAAGFEVNLVNGIRVIKAEDIDYGSRDACSGIATMSISPSTFTCANVGPNEVIFTATDKAGNSASATVTMTVKADATCTPLATSPGVEDDTKLQAYPNPASEQASISFQPAQAGPAQVLVYNSLGQLVTILYDAPVQAMKRYTLTLDSRSLLSGIYFCQLRTAGSTQVARLLVIK
jgi:hypothetical protein